MRGYTLVSLAIGVLYIASVVSLIGGPAIAVWLWVNAKPLADPGAVGDSPPGPLAGYTPAELTSAAIVIGTGGITFSLVFGFLAQLLTMLRNQAINSDHIVRLMTEIVTFRETDFAASTRDTMSPNGQRARRPAAPAERKSAAPGSAGAAGSATAAESGGREASRGPEPDATEPAERETPAHESQPKSDK
jgi:hypothetical protein